MTTVEFINEPGMTNVEFVDKNYRTTYFDNHSATWAVLTHTEITMTISCNKYSYESNCTVDDCCS